MGRRVVKWIGFGMAAALWAGDPSAPPKTVSAADNRLCAACHQDQEVDALAASHAKGGIGCVNCHGPSVKHAAEKETVTPPDMRFPKRQVNAFCQQCHLRENLSDQHAPFLAGKIEKQFCHECHGRHQMESRTRLWDRETGKPLSKEAVKKENAARTRQQRK